MQLELETKTCYLCGKDKPIDQFYKTKSKIYHCIPCKAQYSKEWNTVNLSKPKEERTPRPYYPSYRETHPEEWTKYIREYMQVYRANNKKKLVVYQRVRRNIASENIPIPGYCEHCYKSKYVEVYINPQFVQSYGPGIELEEVIKNTSFYCHECICEHRNVKRDF